jgi:cytochrome P450
MLTQKQAESFRPIQQYESKQMAVDWLESPQDYYQHTRRYAFSLIMQVVYGRRFPKWGSKESDDIFGVNANLSYALTPGKFIVDTFPSLENIPGFGTIFGNWRKTGERLFQQDARVLVGYYRTMKDQLANDNGYPCFARDLEENDPASHGMDEVEAAYLAGGLVMPGSESTSALLNWLVRALATWPDIQTDARAELDRVVGSERTPRWDDESQLPYIRAMVKELLRWCLGSKFGLIRSTSQDDWSQAVEDGVLTFRFEGMFIPKGSKVVVNQWSLHFDDGRWPEPLRYNPKRYLGSVALSKSAFENLNASNPEERDHWGYGAGRRWCPGTPNIPSDVN